MEEITMFDSINHVFQQRQEEFLFLGKIYKDQKMDFGKWYDDFFKSGGFEKLAPYRKNENDCLESVHVMLSDYWNVGIGVIASNISEAPEEFELKKYPAGEFLVISSDWKTTNEEAHKSLDQFDPKYKQMPCGYVEDTATYICIEKFYECSEKGHRWERWYPIKKQ